MISNQRLPPSAWRRRTAAPAAMQPLAQHHRSFSDRIRTTMRGTAVGHGLQPGGQAMTDGH